MKFIGQSFQKLEPQQTDKTYTRNLKHYHAALPGGKMIQ